MKSSLLSKITIYVKSWSRNKLFRFSVKKLIPFALAIFLFAVILNYKYSNPNSPQTSDDVSFFSSNKARRALSSWTDVISQQCQPALRNPKVADFDLKQLTQQLTRLTANGDKGIWSELLENKFEETITRDPLPVKVILLPFSHSDPGWLQTVVSYYDDKTGPTLKNMVEKLEKYPNMTFLWSEISFFSMYWARADHAQKEKMRKLVANGQLEFVNGGYVMTDEATANLYAIVHQYVTGHQFLHSNFNVTVRHGWAIDPFGHSATLPYIYQNLGFESMLIQRVHYNIKEYLGRNRALQFYWQQYWGDGNDKLFCHLSPTFLYSIRESCGPNRDVCAAFDFKTGFNHWAGMPGEAINKHNIDSKARMLVGQYRRMGSVYDHKVFIHKLGDDFRYDSPAEWDDQYNNFQKLINYINSNKDKFNVEVEFGTLKTYYDEVHRRLKVLQELADSGKISDAPAPIPRIEGDFFTYADRYAEYWSGYFTTRPFVKRMGRELEWRLRNAEILATYAGLMAPHTATKMWDPEDEWRIKVASESLGLFQHHDAITGTSQLKVMNDYSARLLSGLDSASLVITNSLRRIITAQTGETINQDDLTVDYQRPDQNSLPQKFLLDIRKNTIERLFLFNPLARRRTALVRVHVNSYDVEVLGNNGEILQHQINPVWTGVDTISNDAFEVVFFTKMKALEMATYIVRIKQPETQMPDGSGKEFKRGDTSKLVTISVSNKKLNNKIFKLDRFPESDIELENSFMKLIFDKATGMLKQYISKRGKHKDVVRKTIVELRKYKTMRSGAYLFHPSDQANELMKRSVIVRVLRGALVSEVDVVYSENIIHKIKLQHTAKNNIHGAYIDVEHIFDIRGMSNDELIMRVSTDIGKEKSRNGSFFNLDWYTDANGFQMMPRKTSRKIPIQGNYYPITNQAYIEYENQRMSLHVNEAHGVTSLKNGQLEVMLDRRLNQDDNRGMAEAVVDNKPTQQFMKLLFEDVQQISSDTVSTPTMLGTLVNQDLNYPVEIILLASDGPGGAFLNSIDPLSGKNVGVSIQPTSSPVLACDINFVMMKPLMKKPSTVGMLFHKYGINCFSETDSLTNAIITEECGNDALSSTVHINSLFTEKTKIKSVKQSGLNFLTSENDPRIMRPDGVRKVKFLNDNRNDNVRFKLDNMQLGAFVVDFDLAKQKKMK